MRSIRELPTIDLRDRFGDRYRISADTATSRKNTDPMYWIIPCRFGEIYPFGHDELAVMVTSIRVANEMRDWSELRVQQDADDAVVFVFHVKHFQKVADRVGARKRRRLSPEHKRKLAESGREYRFSGISHGSNGLKSDQRQTSKAKP